MTFQVAVLTVSDGCARGEREDRSGPALVRRVEEALEGRVVVEGLVPDDREEISRLLRRWALEDPRPHLILTTGGTGLGPRDVTPEATLSVLERRHPGFGELMRAEGAKQTPFAYLSRGEVGTLGRTLVVNLPGSPRGAVESFDALLPLLPHALRLLRDPEEDHPPSEGDSPSQPPDPS